MNNNLTSRNGSIHLYNPKKEGLGSYDINYINAYRKDNKLRNQLTKQDIARHVA